MNAVRFRLSSCNITWWYALWISNVENTVAPHRLTNISSICGSGKLFMITALFGTRKSTQSRIPPFFFRVTTIGETHSDASTDSITSCCTSFCNSLDTSFRIEKGNHLSFCCTGWTSSWSWRWYTNPFAHPNLCSELAATIETAHADLSVVTWPSHS